MSFKERLELAQRMDKGIISLFKRNGFIVEKTGYEQFVSDATKARFRSVHNNPTVTFLRYLPDWFVWQNDQYFFVELKVMDSPIKHVGRVKEMQVKSGYTDLSSENIGAVETAAINNYNRLSSLGIQILVVVYCTFNPRLLFAEWEQNLVKFHNDNVRIGEGNASFTPYTNIHVDRMRTLYDFFAEELNITIPEETKNGLIEYLKS